MGTILKEIRSAYMQGVSAKDLGATGKYNKTTITLNYSVMRRGGYIFGSRPEGWDKSVLPTGRVLTAVIPEHNHLVVEGGKTRETAHKKERDPLQGIRKALSKAKKQGIAKEAILAEIDALYNNVLLYRDGVGVSAYDPTPSDLPEVLGEILKTTGEQQESGRVSVTSVLEALNEEETEPVSETVAPKDLVGRAVKFKVGAVARGGKIVTYGTINNITMFDIVDGKGRNFSLPQDRFTLINE